MIFFSWVLVYDPMIIFSFSLFHFSENLVSLQMIVRVIRVNIVGISNSTVILLYSNLVYQ